MIMETKNKIAVLAMVVGTQTGFDCFGICNKTKPVDSNEEEEEEINIGAEEEEEE